mgnify:CR=1 FL=1
MPTRSGSTRRSARRPGPASRRAGPARRFSRPIGTPLAAARVQGTPERGFSSPALGVQPLVDHQQRLGVVPAGQCLDGTLERHLRRFAKTLPSNRTWARHAPRALRRARARSDSPPARAGTAGARSTATRSVGRRAAAPAPATAARDAAGARRGSSPGGGAPAPSRGWRSVPSSARRWSASAASTGVRSNARSAGTAASPIATSAWRASYPSSGFRSWARRSPSRVRLGCRAADRSAARRTSRSASSNRARGSGRARATRPRRAARREPALLRRFGLHPRARPLEHAAGRNPIGVFEARVHHVPAQGRVATLEQPCARSAGASAHASR